MIDNINLTGEHETFELDPSTFGFRYFDTEEETSKVHLQNFKDMARWFGQIAVRDRPLVIKQWREMAVEADFELINDLFLSKLYDDEETK